MGNLSLIAVIAGGLTIGLVAGSAVCIVPQHERVVRFRLGRVGTTPCGPGVILAVPLVDRIERVSLRTAALPISAEATRTDDGRLVDATVVVYYRISDPIRHVTATEDGVQALAPLTEAALRDLVARYAFEALTRDGDDLREHLRSVLDAHASAWGVEVELVEVQSVVASPADQQPDRVRRIGTGNGSTTTSTTDRERLAARP